MGRGRANGSKCCVAVLVGIARDGHVLVHHRVALLLELLRQHLLEGLKADAHHAERRGHRERVLLHLVPAVGAQFGNRQGAQPDPLRRGPGLDGVSVVDHGGARPQQAQVPVHGVLIQRNHQIDLVAEAGDLFRTRTNGQKSMAAPDDGLISVIGKKMQSASGKDPGKDIARSCNTLPRGTSYGNRKAVRHSSPPLHPAHPNGVSRVYDASGSRSL